MTHDRWFGVEVRHLAALASVAREGSFRGAAEQLGYVQSAVSQQIAQLEQLVGDRLVDRRRGSPDVELTAAGELLLEHAEEILRRLRAAQADLSQGARRRSRVRVGAASSVASGLLPEVIRRLGETSPEVRVALVETAADDALFELVERGDVEIAFGDLPLEDGPFEAQPVFEDTWTLLVDPGSGLADGVVEAAATGAGGSAGVVAAPRSDADVSAETLARTPLIAPAEGGREAVALEAWFAAEGLVPNIVMRSESEATRRALAAAGLGAALVRGARGGIGDDGARDGQLAAIDLSGLVPHRQVAAFWHSQRRLGTAVEALREMAARVGAERAAGERGRAAGAELKAVA